MTVREKSPGPGTYNPKDTLTKRKNEPRVYTASVRNLNQYLTKNLMKETPGPGKYNKIDKPYKKISTDCKIGNSVRSDIILNENPGPGKYNPNKDVTKASAPSAKIALDQIDALVQ